MGGAIIMAVLASGECEQLYVGSDEHFLEPGQVCSDDRSCAGSSNRSISEPSCSSVYHLPRRQKKRFRDSRRRKNLFRQAFELKGKTEIQSDVIAKAEAEISSLRVQWTLYKT